VGVHDQRVRGLQLLQPRLAGFELDQQIGQWRQQRMELFARPFGAGEPVANLLKLGAQRLVAHADRLERPFDLAPWGGCWRDGGRRKPRRRSFVRRLRFLSSSPKRRHSSLPAAEIRKTPGKRRLTHNLLDRGCG
jgi:hypothetical protein